MFPDLRCQWFIPKRDDLLVISPLKQRLATTVILSHSGWSGNVEALSGVLRKRDIWVKNYRDTGYLGVTLTGYGIFKQVIRGYWTWKLEIQTKRDTYFFTFRLCKIFSWAVSLCKKFFKASKITIIAEMAPLFLSRFFSAGIVFENCPTLHSKKNNGPSLYSRDLVRHAEKHCVTNKLECDRNHRGVTQHLIVSLSVCRAWFDWSVLGSQVHTWCGRGGCLEAWLGCS